VPAGRLFVGTSGFAYPAWTPRFYPAGLAARDLLSYYGGRFPAVELNNTFYARPNAAKVAAWLAATPPDFRFAVKAQRGASMRALLTDPVGSVPWLTEPLAAFGERLGAVLYRVPANVRRDDERLAALLGRWPRDLPLCLEFQDPSWLVDETFAALAQAGATLCATDLPDTDDEPTIRRTGAFLYLRLRRHAYPDAALRPGPPGSRRSSRTAGTPTCFSATTTTGARPSSRIGCERRSRPERGRCRAAEMPGLTGRAGPRTLRRAERDEDHQLLGDVVEAVRDCGLDEHDGASPDRPRLAAHGDPATSRHDPVNLVLRVRRLEIRLPHSEDVQPDRQVGRAQEFVPRATRCGASLDEIGEFVGVHSAPLDLIPTRRGYPAADLANGVVPPRNAQFGGRT